MENFKYSLAKRGKSKCPECGRFTFVQYVDSYGVSLHTTVGKCDRSDNCGHHYPPKQYFADNKIPFDDASVFSRERYSNRPATPQPPPSYIDVKVMNRSLNGYDNNRFVQYLITLAGRDIAMDAVTRYAVGTSKNGGTCFWEVDVQGRIRTGKIIVYGDDGHRRKNVTPPVQWVHNVLKLTEFNLSQCLFGEHLLRDTTKTVVIVESEKTAIIASCYLPEFIWLASGGSEGLNAYKCIVLKGRNVILFPDAGQYNKWSGKAKELSKLCNVTISDLIERGATEEERTNGFDLADYLIRFPLADFKKQQPTTPTKPEPEITETTKTPEPSKPQQPDRPVTASPPLNIIKGNTPAFIDSAGQIYIPTRKNSYHIYASAGHLNSPLGLPNVLPIHAVDISGMNRIFIKYLWA